MTINEQDQSQDTSPEVEVEIGSGSEQPISKPASEEMTLNEVGGLLGLETHSDFDKYRDELQTIAEYAQGQGNESPMDIKWFVQQLEMRIATPKLGEKRIANLYRYVYLLKQDSEIQDRLDAASLGGKRGQ